MIQENTIDRDKLVGMALIHDIFDFSRGMATNKVNSLYSAAEG